MKVVLTSVLAFIAYLGSVVSCIWAIVEFILYLVKDKIFNWWSVWSILICGGLALVMFIFSAVFTVKTRNKSVKNFEGKRTSRFQQRLEEMAEERKRAQGKV